MSSVIWANVSPATCPSHIPEPLKQPDSHLTPPPKGIPSKEVPSVKASAKQQQLFPTHKAGLFPAGFTTEHSSAFQQVSRSQKSDVTSAASDYSFATAVFSETGGGTLETVTPEIVTPEIVAATLQKETGADRCTYFRRIPSFACSMDKEAAVPTDSPDSKQAHYLRRE